MVINTDIDVIVQRCMTHLGFSLAKLRTTIFIQTGMVLQYCSPCLKHFCSNLRAEKNKDLVIPTLIL